MGHLREEVFTPIYRLLFENINFEHYFGLLPHAFSSCFFYIKYTYVCMSVYIYVRLWVWIRVYKQYLTW